jgi:hypothetical protein
VILLVQQLVAEKSLCDQGTCIESIGLTGPEIGEANLLKTVMTFAATRRNGKLRTM